MDLARWQYHFEQGSKESVLHALSYYQNEDGGFGHGLENDCWNPNSSPIQTWAATNILRKIEFFDKEHPVIRGIIQFLKSKKYFNGHFWYRTIPSNNDYPHAPWWEAAENYKIENSYNPTACLASFYLLCGEKEDEFYKTAMQIIIEAVEAYMSDNNPEIHCLSCYLELLVT